MLLTHLASDLGATIIITLMLLTHLASDLGATSLQRQ
jgi:hypothetical protein